MSEAESLLAPLLHAESFTLAQIGQSLDGRIATESGHSHYVTGPENLDHLHRLRALVDAVVVGAGTVAEDDPQLTVRRVAGANPVRVVLDPRRRLPLERKVFTDAAAPTLLLAGSGAGERHGEAEILTLPVGADGFAPADVLAALHARGFKRILVEGGGVTISRFLQAGLLDRLHIAVAPLLIGSGRPGLALPPIHHLSEALRPQVRVFPMGTDTLFDCAFG